MLPDLPYKENYGQKTYQLQLHSLYREDLATYSQDDIFNHKQAEGFIYMWGMSNKIWAELNSTNK